tara:strand:- start:50 stop:610 length:561 start_codon:yes stop_codon:yes gene_type:complete
MTQIIINHQSLFGLLTGNTSELYGGLLGSNIPLIISALFFSLFIVASITTGISAFSLHLYRSNEIDTKELEKFFSTPKPLIVTLIYLVFVVLGCVLFLVPGVILALMFSQIYFILADDPDVGIIEVFERSERLTRNYKWQFLALGLEFSFYMLVGLFTLGVWWVWLIPKYYVAYAVFYEELKKENN